MEKLIKEIWKDIPGYKGFYQASSTGLIRSITRTVKGKGKSVFVINGRILIPAYSHGYARVSLSILGKKTNKVVHRLVAKAFIPNPERKPFINHIDGNKRNNKVSNLEWVTTRENEDHAVDNGLKARGLRNPNARLNPLQVRIIRRLHPSLSQRNIAEVFNAGQTTIWNILNKRTWNHL